MASSPTCADELVQEFPNLIRVYRRVERLSGTDTVPTGVDPATGVQSKDVLISPETGVSARIYIPKSTSPNKKLPLLIYFHGGGYIVESAFSPLYHNYLNTLVAEANIVVVSVNYRLAPEHLLPTAFHDSWAAIQWASSHSSQNGPEPWLNDLANFDRLFFSGDSVGGTISHNMGLRVGSEKPEGINLIGIILVCPYFWGKDPIGSENDNPAIQEFVATMWKFTYPESSGLDDPLLNPVMNPNLSGLGCGQVLICVAGKDPLRDRGWYYYEGLSKSGWGGEAEVMDAQGEDHIFHLNHPTSQAALTLLKKVTSFLNID